MLSFQVLLRALIIYNNKTEYKSPDLVQPVESRTIFGFCSWIIGWQCWCSIFVDSLFFYWWFWSVGGVNLFENERIFFLDCGNSSFFIRLLTLALAKYPNSGLSMPILSNTHLSITPWVLRQLAKRIK
jgi:hypothetical protein